MNKLPNDNRYQHLDFGSLMERLMDPRLWWAYIGVTLLLNLIASCLFVLFNHFCGNKQSMPTLYATIVQAIIYLVVGMILVLIVREKLRQVVRVYDTSEQKRVRSRKGLIFLVSKNSSIRTACDLARDHHAKTITHCWLVYSDDSIDIAKDIKENYDNRFGTGLNTMLRHAKNPFDPEWMRDFILKIFQEAESVQISREEIIADITGMPLPASLGVVTASIATGRPVQYVYTDYTTMPIIPKEVWEIDLNRITIDRPNKPTSENQIAPPTSQLR